MYTATTSIGRFGQTGCFVGPACDLCFEDELVTVAELIDQLKTFDPDTFVVLRREDERIVDGPCTAGYQYVRGTWSSNGFRLDEDGAYRLLLVSPYDEE